MVGIAPSVGGSSPVPRTRRTRDLSQRAGNECSRDEIDVVRIGGRTTRWILGAAMSASVTLGLGTVVTTAVPARADTRMTLPPDSQLLTVPAEITTPVEPSDFALLAAMDDEPPPAAQPAVLAPGGARRVLPLTHLVEVGDVAFISIVGAFALRALTRGRSAARPA